MSEYITKDIVSAIATGDSNVAKQAILSVLNQNSLADLEVRKAEVAQTMFADPVSSDGEQEDSEKLVALDTETGETEENEVTQEV